MYHYIRIIETNLVESESTHLFALCLVFPACSSNCDVCTDGSTCTTCGSGYYLDGSNACTGDLSIMLMLYYNFY